jgi:uncharacterized protein YlxW (UPF0749 family)
MKKNIKKGKVTMAFAISIACFALALVMSMQFKIVNQTDITEIENMRETELRTELANWKAKYEETEAKYEETVSKIQEYQQTKESNEETEKLVDAELEQVNMTLGKTDVEGEGIEIVLNETDSEDVIQISANDLLVIVNALKLAGAEAISINDERIINMSDIVTINGTYTNFIKVNGQRILAPYTIKAIGNQTYLESALLGNGGYVDELKKTGHDVSIEKVNKLKINKYEDEIKTKYIE